MDEQRIWTATYQQDGIELTQIKVDGGLMTDQHAAHAKAWLAAQQAPANAHDASRSRWRKTLKVSATIAAIVGAASTLALILD